MDDLESLEREVDNLWNEVMNKILQWKELDKKLTIKKLLSKMKRDI